MYHVCKDCSPSKEVLPQSVPWTTYLETVAVTHRHSANIYIGYSLHKEDRQTPCTQWMQAANETQQTSNDEKVTSSFSEMWQENKNFGIHLQVCRHTCSRWVFPKLKFKEELVSPSWFLSLILVVSSEGKRVCKICFVRHDGMELLHTSTLHFLLTLTISLLKIKIVLCSNSSEMWGQCWVMVMFVFNETRFSLYS